MAEPESFFKRLTRIFKSGPAVHRRVKGKDIRSYHGTQMIQGNYGYRASAPFGFGRENSPFSILGSYGILDRMARYCLTGDMRIATNTKEGSVGLEELVNHYQKFPEQKYHTFSYDKINDKIVLAEIKHAFLTKIDEVVEVHLEDGTVFKCTKEHPLMLRDGTYCEVKDLKEGMALMPFYRKKLKKYKTNRNSYRVIYSPSEGWKGEHKIVVEYATGNKDLTKENKHVHHKDYNGLNNIIQNLEVLDKDEHMLLHAKEGKRSGERIAEIHHLKALKNIEKIKSIKHNTGRSLRKNKKLDKNKTGFKNSNSDKNFTIETIKENWVPNISAQKLAQKCGVHYGKFNSRLKWAGYESYVDFVRNNFDLKYNLKYKKPRHLFELPTIQDVYNNYHREITSTRLSKKLGITSDRLLVILRRNGYISWHDFTIRYKNHKVKKVIFTGKQERVYDITVEPYHNFAVYDPTGKSSMISHNSEFSEMNYQPEISTALDLFAEETVGGDDRGKSFHIYSDNSEIKAALDDLFYDVLNVEFNLKPWVRNLVQYGDFFLFNEVHPDLGVINVIPIPVNEIEREEGFDVEDPYAIRYKWLTRGSKYLENWQVTHLRLLGNDLFLPYGTSMLESSRRTWRQLMMLEDSMLIYRVVRCLHGDTNVQTENGYKKIKDIKVGDKVYSFDQNTNNLVLSEVTDWVNNGKQQIWNIKTKHRSIKANDNHPILVKNKKTGVVDYVQVKDLIPKIHQIIAPAKDPNSGKKIPVSLQIEKYEWFGHLTQRGIETFKESKFERSKLSIERKLAKKHNIPTDRIHQFLYAKPDKIKGLSYNIAEDICSRFGISKNELVKYPKGMYNLERVSLPQYVDKEFAQFFGFMLGDGYVGQNFHKIGFAAGDKEHINDFYRKILEKYTGFVSFKRDYRSNISCVGQVYSQCFFFANLLKDMGFIPGVYNKRIPSWVFKADNEIKESFLDGLIDADGHRRIQHKTKSCEIELCNKGLIEDVKELCHQLGWNVSSKVYERTRKSRKINGNFIKCDTTTSFSIYFTKEKTELFENILSIEPTNEFANVFDIRVNNDLHNFIADGMVVHNSPERRVFYIDVGNTDPNDVPNYMEAAKATLRSRDVIDRSTGREDHRLNTLAMTDDYFIPVRGPQGGTRVDTLQAGQNVTATEDVEYIQRKLFAGLKVPKPYLNFDENLCLLGDTEIPILLNENKKEHTNKVKIQDLAKLEKYQDLIKQGKLWVYSTNLDGTLVPGKVKNCWETKKVKSSLRITLDNGDKIDCTENHPFLLREGTYVRADELKPNDSLMPLYRKISDKKKGSDKLHGYEMVWDNAAQKWIYTHQMVAKGSKIDKEQQVLAENIQVVHHKDFNKLNNNPENLILMDRKSHGKLHGKLAKKYLLSPEGIAKLNEARKTKEFWEKHQKGIEKAWSNEKQANKRKKIIAETNRQCNKIEKMHSRLAQLRKEGFMSGKNAPNYKVRPTIEEVCRTIKKGTVKPYDIKANLNCSAAGLREVIREHANISVFDFVRKYIKTNNLNISYKTWNVQVDFEELKSIAFCSKSKTEFYYLSGISRETFTRRCKDKGIIPNKWLDLYLNKHNHKVVSVEILQYAEPEPVYDLEIEKYHNFAVNSGVFVHNSAKASLAQMDVRFSRTIQSLQKVIVAEMNKLAMIHLFSMNFDGQDLVNFELKLSNPSSVALQQKLELWSVKMDIAGTAKETKLVDERWIQRHILELTDPEVSEIEKGLRKDRYREMEIEALEPKEVDKTQPSKTTDLFDPTNYEIIGGDVPKEPPAEDNSDSSPISVTLDKINGEEAFVLELEKSKKEEEKMSAPIEPTQPSTPFLNRHEKNRKRRVGVGRGRHNTAMPDMAAMMSSKNKYNKDIHGQRTEGVEYTSKEILMDDDYDHFIEIEPTLSREMKSKLRSMETAFNSKKVVVNKNLLIEELELELDEIEQDKDEFGVIEEIIKGKDSGEVETVEEKTLVEILNDEF